MIKRINYLFILLFLFLTGCDIDNASLQKITFYDNQEIIALKEIKNGDSIEFPESIKEGYDFVGWYCDSLFTIPYEQNIISKDISLYGKWQKKEYKISFIVDNETFIEEYVKYGDVVNIPKNPQKEGYEFLGWHTNDAFIDKYDFSNKISSNITLLASWEKKDYTVTFITNSGNEIFTQKIMYNETVFIPENPQKEGYEFLGWYIDDSFINKYDFNNKISSDITLYASWEKIIKYVTIYFVDEDNIVNSVDIIEGSKVENQQISKVGYTLNGWTLSYDDGELFDFNQEIYEDLILFAVWKENPIIISFNTLGGNPIENIEVERRSKFPEIDNPIKEHYIFSGWYYDLDVTDKVNYEKNIFSDLTVYAKWEKDPNYFYQITFNLGNECWNNKDELRKAFYLDFYLFLQDNTDLNFETLQISSFEDFDAFCTNWNVRGKSDLYGVGDTLGKYFVTKDTDGLLEEQPTTTFIGYCYQNGKYQEFIPFLMTFFAYWRTDEGYTTATNHGNDFFDSPWASMVDTAKFFFFTSDTLNTKYSWFNSKRVKDALDNIPGVLKRVSSDYSFIDDEYILPTDLKRDGYSFVGWYDNIECNGEMITKTNKEITVYALWKKN